MLNNHIKQNSVSTISRRLFLSPVFCWKYSLWSSHKWVYLLFIWLFYTEYSNASICLWFVFQEEQNRGKPNWEHLNEDLHVLITVEDAQNRAEIKLKRAVEEVKKLLIPAVSICVCKSLIYISRSYFWKIINASAVIENLQSGTLR